jgi:hypothetical protein
MLQEWEIWSASMQRGVVAQGSAASDCWVHVESTTSAQLGSGIAGAMSVFLLALLL